MDHIPDTNKPGNSEQFNLSENTTWEARKPLLFKKDFFELQLEFAKEIQKQTGKPLLHIIRDRTSTLARNAFKYDGLKFIDFKPEVTEENVLDFSYEEYLKSEKADISESVPYYHEGSSGFGCFAYDQADEGGEKKSGEIRIHFYNSEFDTVGPLDKSKIELRKKEIHDVLQDIKKAHPEAKEITGLSWLYNVPAYQRLFPQSYIDSLKVNTQDFQWKRGTTIWGQFIDSEFNLKKDLADELLRRLKNLPVEKPLSDLFKEGPPLMAPLEARGSIEDFYTMYGIEK